MGGKSSSSFFKVAKTASRDLGSVGSMISRSPSLRMIASAPDSSNSRGILIAWFLPFLKILTRHSAPTLLSVCQIRSAFNGSIPGVPHLRCWAVPTQHQRAFRRHLLSRSRARVSASLAASTRSRDRAASNALRSQNDAEGSARTSSIAGKSVAHLRAKQAYPILHLADPLCRSAQQRGLFRQYVQARCPRP